MRGRTKKIFGYFFLSAVFAAGGFSYSYYVPRMEKLVLKKINKLGAGHNPEISLHVGSLTFKPWILGVGLSDLSVTPKGSLKKNIGRISVSQASARVSLLGLLRGQVRIANVKAQGIETQIFLDLKEKSAGEISIPLKKIFQFPLDSIDLDNVILLGRIDPQQTVFKLEGLSLHAENRFQALWVDLSSPSVFLKPSGPTPPVVFQGEVRGLVETDQIRLTALKVKQEDSFLVSSGFFWGDVTKGKITSSEMASKLYFDLATLKDWFSAFAPQVKIPHLKGTINVTSNSGFDKKVPYLNLKARGKNLAFNEFDIGNVQLDATLTDKELKKLSGEIKNRSGSLRLEKMNLSFAEPYKFSLAAAPQVELGAFLQTIGLHDIPLSLNLKGRTECEGVFKESFSMHCAKAEISATKAHVYSQHGKIKHTILKFKQAQASGSFEVTPKDVKFAADLALGEKSKGSAKGSVDYENGFVIFFKGDALDFSDVESLADIKMQGSGSVEGETRGNSHTANMSLDAKMKDFWLDDFGLGQVNAHVLYEKGYLHFKDASGLYGSSRYGGHVSINLPESQIYLYVKSPYLELTDVKSLLQKRLPLDFQLSGTGNAEFKASGPLDIAAMDYEIKASLFRGAVAQEPYDAITAELRAQNGILKAEHVVMKKGPGEITLSGEMKPKWSVDLTAVGKKLRIEQSENIDQLGLDLQGEYNFTTKITGEISHPSVDISAQAKDVIAGSIPVEDSSAHLKINTERLTGEAKLLGGKLNGDFSIPFDDNQPFSLKATAKDLNVASIFEAVSQARQTYDFETRLSLTADLEAPKGGFWKSSGAVTVDHFLIRRGGRSLNSRGKMKLLFNQGVVNSQNFGLYGENSSLKLNIQSSSKESVNAQLNGKVDLNLLGPFLTFASEVRGQLSLNTRLQGSLKDVNMSGSAYLDQGYLKASAFPHPFTDLRADMLFNQKSLFINSFQGEVADGKITGDGRMTFESAHSVPVNIEGSIKEAALNFPEGYKSKGVIGFHLQGNTFPYRFKMNYDVNLCEVTSEFSGGGGTRGVRRSPYLPPALAKESQQPFYLDLDLHFQKPIFISNSLMKANLNGNLNIQGTADALKMRGTLTPVPRGLVFFRDVPFEISTGFIEFDSVPPDNPKLYLAATSRVSETVFDEDRRQTEKQYDVSMLIQGRARNPQLTLTSQPPLPQKDIVSLLALGLTPEALDESKTTGLQVTTTSTTALGAALLQKPVGKKLKDRFGVDMKVTSSQATADVASSAKVTLSKQFSPKLSVSASGTLEANPQSSVKLQYEIKRGLSVIGSWEGKEQGATQNEQSKDTSNSILGLDLEYRVQFK